MISLSQEWAVLSKLMYGKEFVDELADFFRQQKVDEILECGCGDGNVLRGLAERGLKGLGIDENPEMISMALQHNQHPNIQYQLLNWMNLEQIMQTFDAVMCRGNSLSCINWGKEKYDPKTARGIIQESIRLMFEKTKDKGLLYFDTVSDYEVKRGVMNINIDVPGFQLTGTAENDLVSRTRKTYGRGKINGEEFSLTSESYLLMSDELVGLLRVLNLKEIWTPAMLHETHYQVVCARK